jgi:hypothetical protein
VIKTYIGKPAGMYLLKEFPKARVIKPEEFIAGSRLELELVTEKFCQAYNSDAGLEYAKEWENFRDNIAPQSDSVEDYVRDHPLHIPFHDTLVRGAPICVSMSTEEEAETQNNRKSEKPRNRPRKSRPLDYVQWSQRGEKKQPRDPSLLLPNIVIDGPPGIERYSVPVQCSNTKHGASSVLASISSSNIRLPPLTVTGKIDTTVNDIEANIRVSGEVSDDDDNTDSDNDIIDGWITCRGLHNIQLYGCARDCVGNTFTVPSRFIGKAFFANKCSSGKIHSIVRKNGAVSSDVYFKFYNHVEFPEEPPAEDSEAYCFIKCEEFMSSSLSRRMMEWDKKSTVKKPAIKAPREKRTFWQMEVVAPALFDDCDDDVDVSSVRKLRSGRITDSTMESTEPAAIDVAANVVPIVSSAVPDSSPSAPSSAQQTQLPPIHVQRENLRKSIHDKLVKKGLRKPQETNIALSDFSSSDSECDSDTSCSDA